MKSSLEATTYGRVVATTLSHPEAIEQVKSLLKHEGFGVLCDIDVSKTLREKIGADFRPYTILGACNPELAHRALSEESQLGLLLPCNVVIQEEQGATIVSAINAVALLAVAGKPALRPVAELVNARLNRVLDAIAAL